MEVKISAEGAKVTEVPVSSDFPISANGLIAAPSLNSIKYFFFSLDIVNFRFSERALTTDTPTPCSPPETLYVCGQIYHRRVIGS